MGTNLKGRSLLTLLDFTPTEIRYLLDLSHELKAKKKAGIFEYNMRGKSIVLLFEKNSTRTRCAFEVAALQEGATVTYLDYNGSQMGKKESLEDSATVLGRFFDGIEYRGYGQEIVENLAKFSQVPVWNGLTNEDHPTQALADCMTMEEHSAKQLSELKVVFAGDIRNNVAYALMIICAKMGMHFVGLGPKVLAPEEKLLTKCKEIAKETGAKIDIVENIDDIKGADVIYTDVWASMGEEDKIPERVKLLTPYRVTMEMLAKTENPNVLFMHCLPAFHDFETKMAREQLEKGFDVREVTDEVYRSKYSIVYDQAENRLHTIKAVMVATI